MTPDYFGQAELSVFLVFCCSGDCREVLDRICGDSSVQFHRHCASHLSCAIDGGMSYCRRSRKGDGAIGVGLRAVEIGSDIAVTAKTVADLRALPTWPDGLVLDIHVDLDPRLSVVRVERAS